MIRRLSIFAAVVASVLLPSSLLAGGPPFLCLPIDGVTSENQQEAADLLNAKLEGKVHPDRDGLRGVALIERADQWYLAFYMNDDVRLSEVATALEGSPFSIPRVKLHLFGHVILEIDAPAASSKALQTGLESLPHVSVEESKAQNDLLLVTVDMPYPVDEGQREEAGGWATFQRNDFNSTPSTEPRIAATAQQLPGFESIQAVIAKHDASLKNIRWSANYACRVLGGVAAPQPSADAAKPLAKQ